MAIVSKKSIVIRNEKQKKGKLVRVMRDGHIVKMYEDDAIALGLIKKSKKAPANKIKNPQSDKQKNAREQKERDPQKESAIVQAVEFAVIPGIGKASERQLIANGIITFEQLTDAPFDFLSDKVNRALVDYVEGATDPQE